MQKYPNSFHTVLYFSSPTVVIMRLFANYIYKTVNKKFIRNVCSKNYYIPIKEKDGYKKMSTYRGRLHKQNEKKLRENYVFVKRCSHYHSYHLKRK
jgi:hypothetical protein